MPTTEPTWPVVDHEPHEPGVYADGAHGDRYTIRRAADLADAVLARTEGATRFAALWAEADRADDGELFDFLAEEAVQYLNEHTEGGCWSFHEGDLRLDGPEDEGADS